MMKADNINAITKLINLGADVALKNRDGQDASAVATDEGNEELAQHVRRLRTGSHITIDKDSGNCVCI